MKAEYRVRHLDECPCGRWQGGVTYELALGPEGSSYAGRDFLYRVSSAVVELDESEFTPLPDYERIILPLDGELVLRHGDGEPVVLPPLATHRFDGAARTHSRGRAQDFNLMLRKGRCAGDVRVLRGAASKDFAALPDCPCRLFFCARGKLEVALDGEAFALLPGDSLASSGEAARLRVESGGAAIVAHVLLENRDG